MTTPGSHERVPRDGCTAPGPVESIIRTLANRPMSPRQIGVVAICLLINAIDGFDVQATAFTASSIASGWALRPEQLGFVLSAGLIGMGIGALTLSPAADILGRRQTAIGCLLLTALGMFAAAFSRSVVELSLARIATGVGIGALISSVGALMSEYCSDRRRGLAIGFMAISFPAGALICAALSVWLIGRFGWPSVFVAGGVATTAAVPLTIWLLPESLAFLLHSERPGALERANTQLRALALPPLDALAVVPADAEARSRIGTVVSGRLGRRTLRLGLLFLCAMLSFYFMVNWAPKLSVQAGLSLRQSLTVGLLINLGGMIGGVAGGYLINIIGLETTGRLAIAMMVAAIASFGFLVGDARATMPLAVLAGFAMWSVQAAIYTAMMIAFPARVRATAIGLVSTAGRVGSMLGPMLGGALLGAGLTISTTCALLSLPAILAAAFLKEYGGETSR